MTAIPTNERSHDRERIRTVVVSDPDGLARLVADRVAEVIGWETGVKGRCVLGLATGHTPLRTYRELVSRCRAGAVSFAQVVTFNLDEYWPMAPDNPHSYRRYMWENLFAHLDIEAGNVHLPAGDVPREGVAEACAGYERAIREAGGIDFQLLGIGKDGHIGFNEPGSPADSRTRLVALAAETRRSAASEFGGEEQVPREAITMGIATILEAREIALLATGEHKAEIVRRAVESEPTPDVAATFLQRHPNATVYLDGAAASGLTGLARGG